MKKAFKRLKSFLYLLLTGFLGLFGLSNLAPQSPAGHALGQSVTQSVHQASKKTPAQKKAAENPTQTKATDPRKRKPGGSGGSGKPFFKGVSQKRKKHTNLLKCKAKAKRKRKLKRK